MFSWRGPCTVIKKEGTCYTVQHMLTGRIYTRTIINVDRWHGDPEDACTRQQIDKVIRRASGPDGYKPDLFQEGDVILTRDDPPDKVYLSKILSIKDDKCKVQFFVTRGKTAKAKFRLGWISRKGRLEMAKTDGGCPSRGAAPWTGVYRLDSEHIVHTNPLTFQGGRIQGRLAPASAEELRQCQWPHAWTR